MELREIAARVVVWWCVTCGTSATAEIVQDGFAGRLVVEAGRESESADPRWWLSSGAYFDSSSGTGSTILGRLPADDPWRMLYAKTNPLDTEDGYRPQNIFRLVNRAVWGDGVQEVFFAIRDTSRAESPNRAGHNGILFLSRYLDADNLYYAGLRVDGRAVIKRKRAGAYVTLASTTVFPSAAPYDRSSNPNLLPAARWIGIRSTTATSPLGGARVSLEVLDASVDPEWRTVLQVEDADPLAGAGHGGLRSDFLDLELGGYRITSLDTEPSAAAPTVAPPTRAPTATRTPTAPAPTSPTPAATPTPRLVATSTATPRPTSTPTPRPTATLRPTATPRAVPSPTPTSTLCSFSVSPERVAFSSAGGSGTIVVETAAGCEWRATASSRWIHAEDGLHRGPATVSYAVDGNPTRTARSSTIWIGTASVTVTEQGAQATVPTAGSVAIRGLVSALLASVR